MGSKVGRRTCTKLSMKEALPHLFFSIRICLKPLRLALKNFAAPIREAGTNFYWSPIGGDKEFFISDSPIGAEKFCSASPIGAEKFANSEGAYSTIQVAFYIILENPRSSNFYRSPIGAAKFFSANRRGFNQIRMEKIGAEKLISLITSRTCVCRL